MEKPPVGSRRYDIWKKKQEAVEERNKKLYLTPEENQKMLLAAGAAIVKVTLDKNKEKKYNVTDSKETAKRTKNTEKALRRIH